MTIPLEPDRTPPPVDTTAAIIASLRELLARIDEQGLVEAGIAVNEALIALGDKGVDPQDIRAGR